MSFSRRRVGLACTFCRHRKRKCDAKKPACSNCVEAEADCHYDGLPTQRIEGSGSREIMNRLQYIESLLERHTQNVAELSAEIQARPTHADFTGAMAATTPKTQTSHASPDTDTSMNALFHGGEMQSGMWNRNNIAPGSEVGETPPLTIPAKHNTSSSYLLCLPEMKALIGEYPTDLFFLLESRNELPPELTIEGWGTPPSQIHIDMEVTDYLVSVFFSEAYPCHPILDREEFHAIYSRFLEVGIDSSVESALCLVVFALGAAASVPQTTDGTTRLSDRPAGIEYMQAALPILMALSSWSFSWNMLLPQALVLGSVYFAYIVRPLQSWRLIYSASTMLQFKLSRFDSQGEEPSCRESILRLFWSCFLIECDRLAELELPQSGLQQMTDDISLPDCNKLTSLESTCYLAEISIRRLLNRIHNSLYPGKQVTTSLSSTSLAASDIFSTKGIFTATAICDELHRQLDIWYESIPVSFRPSLDIDPLANDRETVLRTRYYATKHIIYRPFVLHVISSDTSQITDSMLEKCGICLQSCRLYLHSTRKILRKSSQYTWTFSLSSLGAIVILTLSSLCPSLKTLVPDIEELQSLVIENITPWASSNSSLEAIISIIQDMQRKQKILALV